MDDISDYEKHVACDMLFDAQLKGIIPDKYAVFSCTGILKAVHMSADENLIGKIGVLIRYHDFFGEEWQFQPYAAQTWRRLPKQDVPGTWMWKCDESAETAGTPVGVVPSHTPICPPRRVDEDAGFFI
jgi:hypothetical protein